MTFLLNKYFFLQMTYELLLQSRKLDKLEGLCKNGGVGKFFEKKKKKKKKAGGCLLGTRQYI